MGEADARKNPSHVFIAEGLATAEAVYQMTQSTFGDRVLVVAAVDAGNIPKVAERLNSMYPQALKVIAADNDQATEKRLGKNPGMIAAQEAIAKYPEMQMAIPESIDGKNTDWNDVYLDFGLEQSTRAILLAMGTHNPKQEASQEKSTLIELQGLCNREIGRKLYQATGGDLTQLPRIQASLDAAGGKVINMELLQKATGMSEVARADAWKKAVSDMPVARKVKSNQDNSKEKTR